MCGRRYLWLFGVLFVIYCLSSIDAEAACKVTNDTKFSFTVVSGHASNQRIPAHSTTFVSAGKIVGRAVDGATIGGYCDDEDELVIKMFQGIPVLLPK